MSGQGPVETIIVGHSRGVGIGLLIATVFAGLEINRPAGGGLASVAPQQHWPLRFHALIGFSPPYAVYQQSDADAGEEVPQGIPDHWAVLQANGIPDRTILFIDDRDIVPSLSFGQGQHFGHRFRIERNDSVTYDGREWGQNVSLIQAHGSAGYCAHVLQALVQDGACRERGQGEPVGEGPG